MQVIHKTRRGRPISILMSDGDFVVQDMTYMEFRDKNNMRMTRQEVEAWIHSKEGYGILEEYIEWRNVIRDIDMVIGGMRMKTVVGEMNSLCKNSLAHFTVKYSYQGNTVDVLVCKYWNKSEIQHMYPNDGVKFTLLDVYSVETGYLAYYLVGVVMKSETPMLGMLNKLNSLHSRLLDTTSEPVDLYDTEVRKSKSSGKTKKTRMQNYQMHKKQSGLFKVRVLPLGYEITHLECGCVYWRDRLSYLASDCGVCPECGLSRHLSGQSKGEIVVRRWLREEGIEFELEKSFPELLGKSWYLRYDFVVHVGDARLVVEVNGKQHYDNSYMKKGSKYDSVKKVYALSYGMYYIAIPDSISEGKMCQLLRLCIEQVASGTAPLDLVTLGGI